MKKKTLPLKHPAAAVFPSTEKATAVIICRSKEVSSAIALSS